MEEKNSFLEAKSFAIELLVYAALVVGYVFFVIGLLGDFLYRLYQTHRTLFSFTALLVIVTQGVVLEAVTSLLLKLIRSRAKYRG